MDFRKLAGAGGGGVVCATGQYYGDGKENQAIAHGLGIVPKMIMILEWGNSDIFMILTSADIGFPAEIVRAGRNAAALGVLDVDATNFYVGTSGEMTASANENGLQYQFFVVG